MADCKTCKYSAFDEQWGEYKCKIRMIRIYDRSKYSNCEDYENKNTKPARTKPERRG